MKRGGWMRSSAAAALALLLAPPLMDVDPAAGDTPPVRIMLVGDSMTEGSSGDWTWRYRLAKYLDAAGVDYDFVGPRTTMLDLVTHEHTSLDYADPAFDRDHFATWGRSLQGILDENAQTPEDSIGWAVASYQPDVVVELLGINDLLYGASPEETLQAAHTFVDEVRTARPDTSLVLSTVPGEQYDHVADYNNLLATTAPTWSQPSSPVILADPAPGWSPSADTCDNTHPSAVGEVRIAAAVQDSLATQGIGAPAPRPLPTPPVGPRRPAVLSVTRGDRRAYLSWRLPPGGTAVMISTRDVSLGDSWRRLPIPIGGSSWTSAGLRNGDTYAYRLHVLKHDCLAADVVSNTARVTPGPAVPGPVAGVEVRPRDHGLRAAWSLTKRAVSYAVWVKPSDRRTGWETHRTTSLALTVHHLQAGRSYDVAVQARNAGGAGRLSKPVSTVPTGARPPAPRWRSGVGSASGSATLRWQAARHANLYRVSYRVDRPRETWVADPRGFTEPSAVVTGLRDGLRYLFRVRGADDRVLGHWSPALAVDVPRVGPVVDVIAKVVRRTHRVRTWGTPVRGATSYTLTSVATRRCGDVPAARLFQVVSGDLTRPRHIFPEPRGARAVWVRWRAAYEGAPGMLARSSTACAVERR